MPDQKVSGFGETTVLGQGTVWIISNMGNQSIPIMLRNAIHAPNALYNLVSIGHMTDTKLILSFKGEYVHIHTLGNLKEILRGRKIGHLYNLNAKINMPDIALAVGFKPVRQVRNKNFIWQWNARNEMFNHRKTGIMTMNVTNCNQRCESEKQPRQLIATQGNETLPLCSSRGRREILSRLWVTWPVHKSHH